MIYVAGIMYILFQKNQKGFTNEPDESIGITPVTDGRRSSLSTHVLSSTHTSFSTSIVPFISRNRHLRKICGLRP